MKCFWRALILLLVCFKFFSFNLHKFSLIKALLKKLSHAGQVKPKSYPNVKQQKKQKQEMIKQNV